VGIPIIGAGVSDLGMSQYIFVRNIVSFLKDIQKPGKGTVLFFGNGPVMVAYKLDSQRRLIKIYFTVPHAFPGVQGNVLRAYRAVNCSVSSYDVIGVTAVAAIVPPPTFAPAYGLQRTGQPAFRSMNNYVLGPFSNHFRKTGRKMTLVINDPA